MFKCLNYGWWYTTSKHFFDKAFSLKKKYFSAALAPTDFDTDVIRPSLGSQHAWLGRKTNFVFRNLINSQATGGASPFS